MIYAAQFRRQHAASFRGEKGQTIALVAVCLVSFVAMSALAIDLTSLYAARGEIQRAADAAALAGAKAFVDSGVVTNPTNKALQTLATQTMAPQYVAAAAAQNLVANAAPQVVSTTPDVTTFPGNPTITVKLQQTNLPLFFSHIWSGNFGTVTATATAEAYNPGQSGTGSQSFVPSAPKCVKPIMFANLAPVGGGNSPFVNVNTGQVTSPGKQFIGISFDACLAGSSAICPLNGKPAAKQYLLMALAPTGQQPHQYCPSTAAQGCGSGTGNAYEQSMECCDGTVFNANQCGIGAQAAWAPNSNLGPTPTPINTGLQCLIHSTGGAVLEDQINRSAFSSGGPLLISPGSFNQARYGLLSTDFVATSDSIITVPIFDQRQFSPPNPQVIIVGFLTLFVNNSGVRPGRFGVTILNVTGCGSSPSTAPPVSGGGVSSIPVRLIQ